MPPAAALAFAAMRLTCSGLSRHSPSVISPVWRERHTRRHLFGVMDATFGHFQEVTARTVELRGLSSVAGPSRLVHALVTPAVTPTKPFGGKVVPSAQTAQAKF